MSSAGISVVVFTYNDARALELVLERLAQQSVAPVDIAIADDGSGAETRALYEAWKPRMPQPLHHVWHEDKGWHKGEIGNKAVLQTRGEHLLFLDGDSIPHTRWVEDHLAFAHLGDVRCGRRVKLGRRLSERVRRGGVAPAALENPAGPLLRAALAGGVRHFRLGLRLPAVVARVMSGPRRLMGVNFSVTRAAFEAVNGYDMNWPGRRMDMELEIRLRKMNFKFASVLHHAVVYHLYHEGSLEPDELKQKLEQLEASGAAYCAHGLDALRHSTVKA